MKIALFAPDSKMPNIAIMKISAWHKAQGDEVVFNPQKSAGIDKTYVSIILTESRAKARKIAQLFPNAEIGGSGWDITGKLPAEIDAMQPDYQLLMAEDLYPLMKGAKSREQRMAVAHDLVTAGIGFSARGCINSCAFCGVAAKEGAIKQVSSIRDLMNPVSGSKKIYLLDNAFCSDPLFKDKIAEIKELGLVVDIQSGIDLRVLDEGTAQALASIQHGSGLRMAWDNPNQESMIMRGISTLKNYFKGDKTCYFLVGYNTCEEEDMMRVRKLHEQNIRPYCMVYRPLDAEMNDKSPEWIRLNHFKRYINGFVYKKAPFSEYLPWVEAQTAMSLQPAFF